MSNPQLSITVRFGGQPLPDVPLATVSTTTIAALKRQIRACMPASYAEHAIKLIYNGRQLRNQITVGQELGLRSGSLDGLAEGRVWYVHCALPLAKEQNWETTEARRAFRDPTVAGSEEDEQMLAQDTLPAGPDVAPQQESPTASTALRGFDRLRSVQSFDTADITSMRTQFRANISARHTPETMPSEQQLLQMEDRWLDNSAFSSSLATAAGAGAATGTSGETAATAVTQVGTGGEPGGDAALELQAGQQLPAPAAAELEAEDDASRALDDTLLGIMTGFFWPIGAVVWGLREEGVWSRRRGWSVLAGVLVNLGFGVVRVLG